MSAPTAGEASGETRCFVALLPDAASRQILQRCRETLARSIAGIARGVRWVEPPALHLTLRFLGASAPAQIAYLKHQLPTLAPALPAIASRRYAIWPNRARPRLLVLELESEPRLVALADDCEVHSRKAGFAPEGRGFRAHVTLARLRPGCAFGILPNPPATITFDSVALMQSKLTQPTATYVELAREMLAR